MMMTIERHLCSGDMEAVEARVAMCAECGCEGVHVDTDAGEIVHDTRVVATVAGVEYLMTDVRGRLVCDDCAE